MYVRLAFGILLVLGLSDLAYINLHLAPQLVLQHTTTQLRANEEPEPLPGKKTPPPVAASASSGVVAATPIASAAAVASSTAVAAIDHPAPTAARPPPDAPPVVATGASAPNEALADINFDLDSTRINYLPAIVTLRDVAAALGRDPSRQLLVRGHSDQMGSSVYKHVVSLRRATTVRAYLISHGARAAQITVEEVGDSEPVDAGNNPVAWARNRRVQLVWR